MILVASFNDAWYDSSLGYAYRKVGDTYEVMNQSTGEWQKTLLSPDYIRIGIQTGALWIISRDSKNRD